MEMALSLGCHPNHLHQRYLCEPGDHVLYESSKFIGCLQNIGKYNFLMLLWLVRV